jgi:hypothetical protein
MATTSAEGTKSPPGWVDLINESVHTSDYILTLATLKL